MSFSENEAAPAFPGRVLYLTRDCDRLARHLGGEALTFDPNIELLDDLSTDEIIPAWACYYYDERLARYALVGLRGERVIAGAVSEGGFSVLVSGHATGCGSSRETAPFALLCAGIRLIVARSFEKIFRQNCQNIGLLTSTDFSLLGRIESGKPLDGSAFWRGLDPISAEIVRRGGLFAYNRRRLSGLSTPPSLSRDERRMTLVEKIVARHAVADAKSGRLGVPSVRPGDALFARVDLRFSHDYVTAMADAFFRRGFGEAAKVEDPDSVLTFRDHLTFLDRVMPEEHRRLRLQESAAELASVQEAFSRRHRLRLYGEVRAETPGARGSEAICHNKIVEDVALPGQIVVGTDSHTCTAGVLGCLAFGVGSTDMANAWLTRDVRITVPETVRIELFGQLSPLSCAKDLMLYLLSQEYFKSGRGLGQVLEFAGAGLAQLSIDERATLTNMAVEAGGFTGIMEPDERVVSYLFRTRGIEPEKLADGLLRSDEGAEYAARLGIDLGQVAPMVATPGDPKNGIPLSELTQKRDIPIDIAYAGSCTGGKMSDMDMYARVLGDALSRGQRVSERVRLFIQFGSQNVRSYAESRGYVKLFEQVGAILLDPSCGACIAAGPGVSTHKDHVTVSAINRNYPGRSGPGQVYLASPLVVAASAVAGKIQAPTIEART